VRASSAAKYTVTLPQVSGRPDRAGPQAIHIAWSDPLAFREGLDDVSDASTMVPPIGIVAETRALRRVFATATCQFFVA
jgi:hypothetical protein